MKKSKIKREIKQAILLNYPQGLTNTANRVLQNINKRIDKLYNNKNGICNR